ncbi:LacI family DNA-binding transcriptional regulator [Microvirga guangxiensis]|uniref:Transcriptional regulator, LacI family n=1 Tax=Microvirga guangxiensis TaxID=549386 RepID=A0A1G5KIU6_9HYPH|nr:LacI family DNA-binding transcriptional regulator [Microvirga guangxiensis]SCZ00543.1 transcriptional regulator, LacI family [Microvirga guangxiensis]
MEASSDHEDNLKRDRGIRNFVTAEDVARLAGVSRSAVSRTFTPGASVSADVRLRVQEAAKTLGYRVNRLARSLISDQSNLVGVVGANLSLPFMARQLDELSRALLRRGMQCLLLNAAEAEQGITPLIELILEFRVRAIVVMSGSPPSSIIDDCVANGVRVILVNRQADDAETDTIISDDLGGARLAAGRLLQAGCRRIGVVGSGARTPTQLRRRVAFAECIEEAGIEPVVWASGETTYETGIEAAEGLLASHDLDGVFCVTDLLALGFLDGARRMGRRVPDDLSVIGFDDIPQSAWVPYHLTTVRQSMSDLTEAVLTAIEREMHGKDMDLVHEVLPVELVERATVRPTA